MHSISFNLRCAISNVFFANIIKTFISSKFIVIFLFLYKHLWILENNDISESITKSVPKD